MQLFALDGSVGVVGASQAQEGKDYQCRDCGRSVRVRGGSLRRRHFYHCHGGHPCRQQGKSLQHLQVQRFLQTQLKGAQLEVSFASIGRIADVLCLDRGLVFEVQCSPISLKEVMERNRDYGSEGLAVIWILHDKRFNQGKCGEAEAYLRSLGCFFTDIDADGKGRIYDQWDVLVEGRRWDRSAGYTVYLGESCATEKAGGEALPQSLKDRSIPRFCGDAVDQAFHDSLLARDWKNREAELKNRLQSRNRVWQACVGLVREWLVTLYRSIIEMHAD